MKNPGGSNAKAAPSGSVKQKKKIDNMDKNSLFYSRIILFEVFRYEKIRCLTCTLCRLV